MKDQIQQILTMLQQGKITQDQAAQLLSALVDSNPPKTDPPRPNQNNVPPPPWAEGVQAFAESVVSAANSAWDGIQSSFSPARDQSGNSVRMSKIDTPTGESFTFKDNSINVSKISGLNLVRSQFTNSRVNASRLASINLSNGSIHDCEFNGSSMEEVQLDDSTLDQVQMHGTKSSKLALIEGSTWKDLAFHGASFRDIRLKGKSSIIDCQWNGISATRVELAASTIKDGKFHGLNLSDLTLENCQWSDIAVHGQRMQRCRFSNCNFHDVEIRNDLWRGSPGVADSSFEDCRLNDCAFIGCIFNRSHISHIDLSDHKVQGMDFSGLTITSNEQMRDILESNRAGTC